MDWPGLYKTQTQHKTHMKADSWWGFARKDKKDWFVWRNTCLDHWLFYM